MTIKDGMIKMVLRTVIKKINKNFDMTDIMDRYEADGRTMSIIITDLGEGTGFSVTKGVLVAGNIDNPTCTVKMKKDILAAIITNKITQQQAFLMGGVEISSNERLRDSIVINRIFGEMRGIIVKS